MGHKFFLGDVETTGVSTTDAACEVAWAEIDESFNVLREGCSLINPGKPIHYAASAVNGITDAMVADAPTLSQYLSDVGNPLASPGSVLVSHNAPFDYRFLKPYMAEDSQTLCTLKMSRIAYPDAANHKQSTLAAMLGIQVAREKAHSADGDLEVLLQLVQCLCRDLDCGLSELLHIQSIPRPVTKITFGKHKGTNLVDLPKQYVSWLLEKAKNIDPDLRAALLAL